MLGVVAYLLWALFYYSIKSDKRVAREENFKGWDISSQQKVQCQPPKREFSETCSAVESAAECHVRTRRTTIAAFGPMSDLDGISLLSEI